jgi:hypothetical protein
VVNASGESYQGRVFAQISRLTSQIGKPTLVALASDSSHFIYPDGTLVSPEAFASILVAFWRVLGAF